MNCSGFRLALAAVLFGCLPASGWSASDAALPEVTVVAPKPPTAEQIAGDNVPTFVKSHGKPGKRTGQLGRWDGAPCVSTQGLSRGFTDFVSTRVQAIAATVNQRLRAAERCKPNVLIIFTTEPQKLLDDVVKRRPELLGFHYIAETPKISTIDRPIQAWYVTGSRGRGGGLEIDDIWHDEAPRDISSRLSLGVSSYIVFVLVVVDTKKVTDFTIGSLSDLIAMMALSQSRIIDGCGELPSILDLMAPDCKSEKSDSITGGDIAYLKALYLIDSRKELFMQRSAIEDIMMQQFKAR
jgi:hypothetical protein